MRNVVTLWLILKLSMASCQINLDRWTRIDIYLNMVTLVVLKICYARLLYLFGFWCWLRFGEVSELLPFWSGVFWALPKYPCLDYLNRGCFQSKIDLSPFVILQFKYFHTKVTIRVENGNKADGSSPDSPLINSTKNKDNSGFDKSHFRSLPFPIGIDASHFLP